jgi:hypothetical protein
MAHVQPIRSKVAIVGTSLSAVATPVDDPAFEVWTCNGAWQDTRSDRHFQMHRPNRDEILDICGADYVTWLERRKAPTYLTDAAEWVPFGIRFPIEELTEMFGETWGSTPCYMLALAIHEGFEEIAICGIDMVNTEEYLGQREWVQYFRGIALGKGIKVTFPGGSALQGRSIRYGYDDSIQIPPQAMETNERKSKLLLQKIDRASVSMHQAEGARNALAGAHKALVDGKLTAAFLEQAIETLAGRRNRAIAEKLADEGALRAMRAERCDLEHIARGGAA